MVNGIISLKMQWDTFDFEFECSLSYIKKTLESPLDCKEIQPAHSEGDQPWDFFGRNDAKAETPVLWPPHAKSWLTGKDSDAGRDWGQEENGPTEDEMAGWHQWHDGRESEWTPGVGDGQGGLACCDSWGCKESDTTEQLNWTELNWVTLTDKTHQNNSLCSQICFPQISKWKWDWMLDKLIWIYKILLPKRHSFIDEGLTAAYLHYHMHCCVFKGFSPEWIADIPGPWKFPRKKSSVSCFFVFLFFL